MKISALMSKDLFVLEPDQTIREAARMFLDRHIDGAPVVNTEGELLGLVTKSSLYRVIAECNDFDAPVTKVMKKNPKVASPEDDLEEVKKLFIGRIPVVQDGKVVGIITQTDLTRAYAHAMNDLNQEISVVIESAYNAIIGIDQNGYITVFNQQAEHLFEMKRRDVIGRLFSSVLPEGGLEDILKLGTVQASQKFKYNNKTLVSNRSPMIIDGKISGAIAVIQDISELESISQELKSTRELKEEFNAIIESSFDGIFVTDHDGKVVLINSAYSRITGINAREVLGRNMRDLVTDGVYNQSVTLQVIDKLEPITIVQKVNTGKTVLVTGNPIFDENGKLFRVLTNVRDITELNSLKQEVEEVQRLNLLYQEQLEKVRMQVHSKYVIRSQKSRDLLDLVVRLGQVDSTVLIQGESGVGKEIIADILHKNSMRKDKPFIRINCGAIPETLLESELFGYESGAFTGAKKGGKIGIFELANKGTLFLDEIGELPMLLQVKLLRVIQEKEITRIGGTRPISVDVRLIAATNRDLWDMVNKNEFRKDLFYRLNVVPITVPPLRDRKEEIPSFVAHFLEIFNEKYGLNRILDDGVLDELMEYDWPGNVRELENVIERAVVTSKDQVIDRVSLPVENVTIPGLESVQELLISKQGKEIKLKETMETIEKNIIQESVQRYHTTRKVAAALGISQPTVVRKAAKYGITLRDNDA